MEPSGWNVVVVGAWNLAILTPDGIRKRLFKVADETPIEVEIVIDRPGTYRVGHGGIVVSPSSMGLDIGSRESGALESLEKAATIARVAIDDLPETPLAAVGVNLRYKANVLPTELQALLELPLDDRLSDEGCIISEWLVRRTIEHRPGVVNVEFVGSPDGTGAVKFNFHRESAEGRELSAWLQRIPEFVEKTNRLLEALHCTPVQREPLQ